MELPKFKYHPDPISTGAIVASEEICECCGKSRGYIYTSSIYAEDEIEFICPWCISDGSAASKFDGMFADDSPLVQAGIPKEVISEVCERTPSYESWQQEEWQHHCGDACEFHGDAKKEDLEKLSGEVLKEFLSKEMIKPEAWEEILEQYEEGENPGVYKFKCRKCNDPICTMDFM